MAGNGKVIRFGDDQDERRNRERPVAVRIFIVEEPKDWYDDPNYRLDGETQLARYDYDWAVPLPQENDTILEYREREHVKPVVFTVTRVLYSYSDDNGLDVQVRVSPLVEP